MKIFSYILMLVAFVSIWFYALVLTSAFAETGLDWKWHLLFHKHGSWKLAAIPVIISSFIFTIFIPAYFYFRAKKLVSGAYFVLFKRSFWTILASYGFLFLFKLVIWRTRIDVFGSPMSFEQSDEIGITFLHLPSGRLFFQSSWPCGQVLVLVALCFAMIRHLELRIEKWILILFTLITALAFSTGYNWLSDVLSAGIFGIFIGNYFRDKTYQTHFERDQLVTSGR